MSLSNIVKEDTVGLASVFNIKCNVCGAINHLETSPTHISGKRGKTTFNINSHAALGCLHTGIGNTHLNNLLSTMNIPTMNHSTFKAREREVGNAVEHVAQTSCKENMNIEMDNAVLAGAVPDDSGLIGIQVSYDMGWQKRGKGHNSLTGQGAAMGLGTGKVLAYATRCKYCRICQNAKKKGKSPRQHDCRKNHTGSSKAMEPDVACELWNAAPEQNIKFSTYVGDDDTTTLSHLHQNVPYGVDKWSDIVHAKRSLTTRLYNLSSRCKFPSSSTLSQKVINYLGKCFTYCIAQNRDADSLKKGLKCIVPHAFGAHENCNESWCGFKKEPLTYRHKDLPHHKDLHGEELKSALTSLFDEYTTDTVTKKLVPFANSQRNEALNSIVGSKNPKIRFYGGSESSDFRVACAVAQRNKGYGYISSTLSHLGIEPGNICISHNTKLDKKREKDNKRKSLKACKVRRHFLQNERISKNAKKEVKEGKTYETGIGLNLSSESTSGPAIQSSTHDLNIENILHKITKKQCEEIEKLVPHCIERPHIIYKTYSPTKSYQFILFDIETSDTGSKAEICQLSAITQNGSTYSSYIMPKSNISPRASRVNNLTIENIKGTRSLCKNSLPVVAMSLEIALSSFSKFIEKHCCIKSSGTKSIPVLIGHNAAVFDVPILLRNAGKSYDEQLDQMNVHFGDSLPLIKSLLQRQHAPLKLSNGEYCRANMSSIYQCLFKDDFDAHDALEDVKALRKILFSPELAIDIKTILNGSQIKTVRDTRVDLDFLDRRLDIFQTFVGSLYCPEARESPITQGMALKIAGSGLSYEDLCSLYQTFGDAGVVGILSSAHYCQQQPKCLGSGDKKPRVTNHKRILKNILMHFQSKYGSKTADQ